ncbi:MAG: hypothetical protein ACHQF4_08215 [Sphingobacteriales bacterium]
MEVHHHPQLEHKPKPWKEYLLEGLMIFLAVFMGFIAENVREGIVERNRGKEYINEMVNNLKYDTIRCDKNIAADQNYCRGLDSLRSELQNAITGEVNGNKLYYFLTRYSNSLYRATFNLSAYTELKNSGSLRLISNKQLAGEISDYYDRRVVAAQSFLPTDLRNELRKMINEFLNWVYLDDFVKGYDQKTALFTPSYNYTKILTMKPALRLLNTNPAALQRLYNEVAEYEVSIKNYIFFMSWTKQGAESLMNSIQKQYSLENE